MLESDFAIGGIGVTASERVVMGLPTIMFSAAPNQDLYLNFFKKIPGIKVITSPIREKVFEVMFWIKFFYNNIQLLRKNSFYAKNYFNADGASKVAKKISLILES